MKTWLIDALGGGFVKQSALHRAACRSKHACLHLLLERGANVGVRDFPDNAYSLHVAAAVADLETIEILVEAGSEDVEDLVEERKECFALISIRVDRVAQRELKRCRACQCRTHYHCQRYQDGHAATHQQYLA